MVQQFVMSRVTATASRALTRSMCTTATALLSVAASPSAVASSNSNITPSRPRKNKKTARKQKQRTDDLLRRAIELYHLTPHFLPTPEAVNSEADANPGSSPSDWESVLDQNIHSTIRESITTAKLRAMIFPQGLGEFSREQSLLASNTPSFGRDDASAWERTRDTNDFANEMLTSTTFITKQEREVAAALASSGSSESAPTSASGSALLDHFTDSDLEMYQRRHNQGSAEVSNNTTRKSGAERPTALDRIIPGQNDWYRSQHLDARSARVRDAIFGTINGELPGLEVVRERIARMKKERKQEKQA